LLALAILSAAPIPLADRVVPAALVLIDVDARFLPQSQLSEMGDRAIPGVK